MRSRSGPAQYPPEYGAWRERRAYDPIIALPGGESLGAFAERAVEAAATADALATRHDVLIVSHRLLIGAIAALHDGHRHPAEIFGYASEFRLAPAQLWTARPREGTARPPPIRTLRVPRVRLEGTAPDLQFLITGAARTPVPSMMTSSTPVPVMTIGDDIGRFARAEQLASWAGLTPKHHETDTTVHRGRITMQGSPLVRWAAVEAVQRVPAHSLDAANNRRRDP